MYRVNMRIFILNVLLFNFCHCVENSDGSMNGQQEKVNEDHLKGKDQNQDYIIRPCPLQDLNCIRRFFSQNTQCLMTEGPAPDPYALHLVPNLHVPHANLTFELIQPQIKGLNKWKIEEFYINKATDRLVLEAVFEKIDVTCPKAILKYHRKGKEPIEVSDFTFIEYNDLSFTLTIPNLKDLQLSRGNVYTYVNDVLPKYTLGPNIYSSKDPGFIIAMIELQSKLELSLKEVLLFQGPVFFFAFFKSNICDFGYY